MFSDILKELRAKSGMSQGQLAKAVGAVSYTHLTLPTKA